MPSRRSCTSSPTSAWPTPSSATPSTGPAAKSKPRASPTSWPPPVGLATDTYSFPYVAGWAGGDPSVVAETAERVITCARTILGALPDRLTAVA
jgi:hypothetical protein